MADNDESGLPPPSAEDLRIAAGHFEYAHRVTSAGSHDIAFENDPLPVANDNAHQRPHAL